MRLSDACLPALPADVGRPAYDRGAIGRGIVHLGIGAFHRAHQAVAVDTCLARGETEWGIVAASLRSPDTRDALAPQDGLYTVAVRDSDSEQLQVIGSVANLLVAPESPGRLLDAMADPAVCIVSLTVTEKGYLVDLGTGGLRADHPDVAHDLAHPGQPRSTLGFLAEAIARRRAAGTPPFTLLTCDNLPSNGRTLARLLDAFARRRDPGLADYIAAEVPCPCSMVDRIVPATTDEDRAHVAGRLGYDDAWPVMTEPFFQWVIEDRFVRGRPTLEAAGVEFVADVAPFEHMKLRLLNGAHSALAAAGRLAGRQSVSEAMADPLVRGFVEALWQEAIPTLSIPAADAYAYTRRLVERFDNRALHHLTRQIAGDASQKIPQRIVTPLSERLAAGQPSPAMIFALAAWIRSCGGYDDEGRPLPFVDPTFQAWTGAPDQRSTPPDAVVDAYLTLGFVFGPDLPRRPAFTSALKAAYAEIAGKGISAALAAAFPRGDQR